MMTIADSCNALLALNRKPAVPEVLPIARAYCRRKGNGVGGSLHVVLDDRNVQDAHIDGCIEEAAQRGDDDGMALALLLRRMSRTQRLKLARNMWSGV